MRNLAKLALLPALVTRGISYHAPNVLSDGLPKLLMYVVTRKCNSRCVMCRSWRGDYKHDDLTIGEIRDIFSNPYFSRLEGVIISGGEPTLRKDLPEIIKIIYENCPRLKFVWTSSNGFSTDILEERLKGILDSIGRERAGQITFNISIDGIGQTHDRIRGVEGGYGRALKSLEFLTSVRKKYPIQVTINTVIQPENIGELEEIRAMASDMGVEAVFSPLMDDFFFASENVASGMKFSEEQMRKYRDFINKSFGSSLLPVGLYWETFMGMLDGHQRRIPCGFDRHAVVLEPDGNLRICTMQDRTETGNLRDGFSSGDIVRESLDIRLKLKENACKGCPNYCTAEYAIENEFFKYAGFVFRRLVSSCLARGSR